MSRGPLNRSVSKLYARRDRDALVRVRIVAAVFSAKSPSAWRTRSAIAIAAHRRNWIDER
jgi:hypothetical protein